LNKMALFNPPQSDIGSLQNKVVVLTGGANGIGAATVRLLARKGAVVVFGDVDAAAAQSLIESIHDEFRKNRGEYVQSPCVGFLPVDVSLYADNVNLFSTALSRHGRVDHAISIAGISETGSWFEPSLSIDDIAQPPSTSTLDVNLIGVCFFARVAAVYLRHSQTISGGESPATLTLMSSVLGFKAGARIPMYSVSKHGVLGLMRSLEKALPRKHGVRVNAVCPWVTDTNIVKGLTKGWEKAGFALNTADDVANVMVKLTCMKNAQANGMALYIEGGRAWNIQEGLDREERSWWGEELCKEYERSEIMARAWADGGGHLKI